MASTHNNNPCHHAPAFGEMNVTAFKCASSRAGELTSKYSYISMYPSKCAWTKGEEQRN